jgi:ABC-2 type transport system permease protein
MRAAALIAAKDLRERVRDRSALLIGIVVPLVLALVFGVTLKDVSDEDVSFEYALVDEDRGRVSRAFETEVLAGLERDGLVKLVRPGSTEAARELVEDGDVAAAFVLPAGISQAVEQGRPARLEVAADPDAPIGTLVATSIAEGFAAEIGAVQTAIATVAALSGASPSPEEAEALARKAAAEPAPVAVDDLAAERRELEAATFYAAGMAVFFLFFTVQFGVSSLLDERRDGTLRRLAASPIPRWSILGGKLLTSYVLGVASMAVLVVATSFAVGADWGNPLGVALLVACGVLAATAVMALVATLARTPEQAGTWQAVVALVLGMLGGAFFPVARAGGAIETVSLATPHAWFLRGLGELASGAGASAVLPACGAILAFAAVVGGAAFLRLGRLAQP